MERNHRRLQALGYVQRRAVDGDYGTGRKNKRDEFIKSSQACQAVDFG
jgi:hypothetical protein